MSKLPRIGDISPWGPVQAIETLSPSGIDFPGMVFVETADHGGFILTDRLNKRIPRQWRNPDGYYEEDCGWAPLAITFPVAFNADQQQLALDVIQAWESWSRRGTRGTG